MSKRLLASGVATAAGVFLSAWFFGATARTQAPPPGAPHMTAAEYDAMFAANNNWGRWGKDDKLGVINLITEAKKKQAAGLVKSGLSVSAAHNLSTEEAPDNPNPLKLTMGANFRSDTLTFNYHGTFVTHIDSLCHF